ncbi:MAG TPA: helix-turn-helix transcriptional regulator [Candidatus Lustribacter sp.]|nr:helix-turn-helix transcriptional regulator [Candidatus Lustribacter sp.]
MAETVGPRAKHSPVGASHAGRAARRAQNAQYREGRARDEAAEACARELIRYRMQHGMTQVQLAALLGMPAPVVSRLERGDHVPSIETLERVAHAIGKRLDILFVELDLAEA